MFLLVLAFYVILIFDYVCGKVQINLNDKYSGLKVNIFTVEVTTLGIISDINSFSLSNLNSNMSAQTISEIVRTVISKSFTIYCNRNNSA